MEVVGEEGRARTAIANPRPWPAGEPSMAELSILYEVARDAVMATARMADEGYWWSARDLREATRAGHPMSAFTGDVLMYAVTSLVGDGKLELDAKLRVRPANPPLPQEVSHEWRP